MYVYGPKTSRSKPTADIYRNEEGGVDCGAVAGSLGRSTAEHHSRRGREVGRSDRKQRE